MVYEQRICFFLFVGVEVCAEYEGQAGVYCAHAVFGQHGRLLACFDADVVEVCVAVNEAFAALDVFKHGPQCNAQACGFPAEGRFFGRFRQPVVAAFYKAVLVGAVEYGCAFAAVLSVVAAGVYAFISFYARLYILELLVNHLLHAEQVGLYFVDVFAHPVSALVPLVFGSVSAVEATDVERHYAQLDGAV